MEDLRSSPVDTSLPLGGTGVGLPPPPPMPTRSWRRDRWSRVLLLVVVVFGALALLGVVAVNRSHSGVQEGSTFHQANLAQGETASLAAMLVDVPGYRYEDASPVEVQQAQQDEPMTEVGVSLHSVVNEQGIEVAFLQLHEFAPGVIPEGHDAAVVARMWGAEPTSQTQIGGQSVFLFENPAQPQSRYMYVWLSHRTLAVADSGDGQQILRWIRAYLPVLGASTS